MNALNFLKICAILESCRVSILQFSDSFALKKAKLKLEKSAFFAISPQCWIKTASNMSSMGAAQRSPAEHRELRKYIIPVSKSTISDAKWHMIARKWLIYYWNFATSRQCWIFCAPPPPSMLVFHEKFLHFTRDLERRHARGPRENQHWGGGEEEGKAGAFIFPIVNRRKSTELCDFYRKNMTKWCIFLILLFGFCTS